MVFTDWYEPGYKAGGPIQSCRNIINNFSGDYQFFVITSDRDLGDSEPYQGISADRWTRIDNGTNIWYASRRGAFRPVVRKLLLEVVPDVIYLNSMFSIRFTLIPLSLLRRLSVATRIVLAPRGMLRLGAVQRKSMKKKVFLSLFAATYLPRKIIFHATDTQEADDIRKFFPEAINVRLASNIPNVRSQLWAPREKVSGVMRCIFISRIDPIKNLTLTLQLLKRAAESCRISFDIFGPADDKRYYEACVDEASKLPQNRPVQFKGPLPSTRIFDTLQDYHLFFLPTRGENFGHAIFEALSAGCPVLISDQTPWQDLEDNGAGWALPLNAENAFVEKLEHVCMMNQQQFDRHSRSAYEYAQSYARRIQIEQQYHELFQ